MGMFDEVTARCPRCETVVEFQSKAGPCILKTYNAEDGVPPEIAVDVMHDREECRGCGETLKLIPTIPIRTIPMRLVIAEDEDDD